jgi:hypothetical protein
MLWANYTILAEKILEYRKELQDIMNGAETDVSIERLANTISELEYHAKVAYDEYAESLMQHNITPKANYI